MDELTLERYPHGVPAAEAYTRPSPPPRQQARNVSAAVGLTATERAMLTGFAAGLPAHMIAAEQGVTASAVRGFLYRCCDFNQARARLLIDGGPGPEADDTELPPARPPADGTVGLDSLRAIGLSYRRIDYWTSQGLLRCATGANPGSGTARRWPVEEVAIGALMQRLVDAGLELMAAARVARDQDHMLALGIRLAIDEDDKPPQVASAWVTAT